MKTFVKNFYDKLIGKCDDFAKSCTQDEIAVTAGIMVVFLGIGIWIIYLI